jgi:hypothetical protein
VAALQLVALQLVALQLVALQLVALQLVAQYQLLVSTVTTTSGRSCRHRYTE